MSEEWFEREPRYSLPPPLSVPPPPPKLPSAPRTILAGVVIGAVGGAAALSIAQALAKTDANHAIARALSQSSGVPDAVWAFGVACSIGAFIAVLVAMLTRHVQRALPIAMFGAIFAPVLWLCLHVFALRRHDELLLALRLGPMLVGIAVFGALLALIVPVRGR